MAKMVRARIKRMGKHWASCGVPVSPPPHLKGKASAKRLCPKLVPGQVIEIPSDHNLLNQDCVEIVRRLEADEFLRPWVFPTAEAALLANPTKSRMGADQIAAGLSLAEGAQEKGRKALSERQAAASRAELAERAARGEEPRGRGEEPEDDDDFDDAEDEAEQDAYVPRADNRMTKEEADELRGRDDDEDPEPEPEPEPVRGRRRSPRARR